jgi:hypothetical protein
MAKSAAGMLVKQPHRHHFVLLLEKCRTRQKETMRFLAGFDFSTSKFLQSVFVVSFD